MTDSEKLREILLKKSVIVGEEGQFTLASGAKSNFYVDCRPTAMDAEGAALVGRLGWEQIKMADVGATGVGGLTMGADPVGLAIAIASGADRTSEEVLHAFAVRKEPKGHGRGKQIEGNFSEGMRVVVVDDVITTGGSTLKAIDAIEAAGGKVVLAVVMVDREEGGREAIESRGIPVAALFEKSDLL
jgi:orotate phosphoribosyltransferase